MQYLYCVICVCVGGVEVQYKLERFRQMRWEYIFLIYVLPPTPSRPLHQTSSCIMAAGALQSQKRMHPFIPYH